MRDLVTWRFKTHCSSDISNSRWAQETIDNKIYVSKGLITNSEWVEGKVL